MEIEIVYDVPISELQPRQWLDMTHGFQICLKLVEGDYQRYGSSHAQTLLTELFGNTLGYNRIVLCVRAPFEYWDEPYLLHVTDFGIVVGWDSVPYERGVQAGFHNTLVPWSNIVSIYQYIAT